MQRQRRLGCEAITIYVFIGNTGPTVTGALLEVKSNGSIGPVDLTTATVNFVMRSAFGSTHLVDAAAGVVGDPLDGLVRYDWTLNDTTTAINSHAGPYKAWWHLDYGGGSTTDAPEFDVHFLDHSSTRREVGPCSDWCSSQDVIGCYPDLTPGACLTSATRMASEVLFEASGRQFPGWCQSVIRPCGDQGCWGGMQILDRGHIIWTGERWELDGEPCACGGYLPKIKLPGQPQDIVEVLIGGVLVPASSYRLDSDGSLVRTDGAFWPICQNMLADATEPGTFQVTFEHGYAPPEVGRRAAAELAREFWRNCNGQACQLPSGVVEVVRQGITIRRAASLFKEGATGLSTVDAFLSVFGQAPTVLVLSPDTYPTERRLS